MYTKGSSISITETGVSFQLARAMEKSADLNHSVGSHQTPGLFISTIASTLSGMPNSSKHTSIWLGGTPFIWLIYPRRVRRFSRVAESSEPLCYLNDGNEILIDLAAGTRRCELRAHESG